jgi:hypothetical protein
VPRPTRGPRNSLTRTGLSPSLARRSRRFRFESPGHWPGPRSLAATCGVAPLAQRAKRSCCCPFLRLLRCFSSPGSPPAAIDSPQATAKAVGCPIRRSEDQQLLALPLGFSQRATSFIASRCQGIHQMPFSCCARAQPQARGQAACRDQMSEVGCQRAPLPATRPALAFSDLRSLISDLRNRRRHSPGRCSRIGLRIPMPRPDLIPPDDDRTCFTVTTRFTMS